MYKVLLVDDERMILEGISSIVDWQNQGVKLIGAVRNGIEALEFMEQEEPHIVITDITMPGLDGLQLVERGSDLYPNVKWILLSGFNEFEYAQKAMSFGVKHYLLKPCNEEVISQAIRETVAELEEWEEQSNYLDKVKSKVDQWICDEKERLTYALISGQIVEGADLEAVSKHLNINTEEPFRIVLMSRNDCDQLYAQQTLLHELEFVLGDKLKNAQFLDRDKLVIVLHHELVESKLEALLSHFVRKMKGIAITVIGRLCTVQTCATVYKKMLVILEEQFYNEEGCPIVLTDHHTFSENDSDYYQYNEQKLIRMLKAGEMEKALLEIDYLLNRMKQERLLPSLVKSYFTHLYLSIVKWSVSFSSKDRIEAMVSIEHVKVMNEFIPLFQKLFTRFYSLNHKETGRTNSELVEKMLTIVDENLGNPNLTLQWVAAKKLYMNADYVGKRFKKEMNVKFSTYVTNKRIEKAVEMIEEENGIRVFELAERLGFGDNPQYFSQLFKKITGSTPSDIMKYS